MFCLYFFLKNERDSDTTVILYLDIVVNLVNLGFPFGLCTSFTSSLETETKNTIENFTVNLKINMFTIYYKIFYVK